MAYRLVNYFRSDEMFNDTLIMFLTARGEDYSHIAAYEAGADDYVFKNQLNQKF